MPVPDQDQGLLVAEMQELSLLRIVKLQAVSRRLDSPPSQDVEVKLQAFGICGWIGRGSLSDSVHGALALTK